MTALTVGADFNWAERYNHLSPKWHQREAVMHGIAAVAILGGAAAAVGAVYAATPLLTSAAAVVAVALVITGFTQLTRQFWDDPQYRQAQGEVAVRTINHKQLSYPEIRRRFGSKIDKYEILTKADLQKLLSQNFTEYSSFKNKHGTGPLTNQIFTPDNSPWLATAIEQEIANSSNYGEAKRNFSVELSWLPNNTNQQVLIGLVSDDFEKLNYRDFQKKHGSGPVQDRMFSPEIMRPKIFETLMTITTYSEMQRVYGPEVELLGKDGIRELLLERVQSKGLLELYQEQGNGLWEMIHGCVFEANIFKARALAETAKMEISEIIKKYSWNIFTLRILSPEDNAGNFSKSIQARAEEEILKTPSVDKILEKFGGVKEGWQLVSTGLVDRNKFAELLERTLDRLKDYDEFLEKITLRALDYSVVTDVAKNRLTKLYLIRLSSKSFEEFLKCNSWNGAKRFLPLPLVTKLEELKGEKAVASFQLSEKQQQIHQLYERSLRNLEHSKETALSATRQRVIDQEWEISSLNGKISSLERRFLDAQSDEARVAIKIELERRRSERKAASTNLFITNLGVNLAKSEQESIYKRGQEAALQTRDMALVSAKQAYSATLDRIRSDYKQLVNENLKTL